MVFRSNTSQEVVRIVQFVHVGEQNCILVKYREHVDPMDLNAYMGYLSRIDGLFRRKGLFFSSPFLSSLSSLFLPLSHSKKE